nr:MAG TPA: hypothetical protein [Caudoviricetes sp.]
MLYIYRNTRRYSVLRIQKHETADFNLPESSKNRNYPRGKLNEAANLGR